MKRGEIWWVAVGSSEGGEVRKERPAVIISNDAANRHLNRGDQLTTVAKARLIDQAGRLSSSELRRVERAVAVQLGLGEIASARG